MTSKTFVPGTVIDSVWLNDVNATTYGLPTNGGAALVGFTQSGTGSVLRTLQDEARDRVNVKQFGAKGDGVTDDTAAFNKASISGRRVFIPAGTYIIDSANFPASTEFFGEGNTSILKMAAGASYLFTCDSGSSNTANNITKFILRNVQCRATADIDGFSEFKHLISINGASDVLFENVLFKGFRGDGLYVGSGNVAGTERHNERVTVRKCCFDGINHANRNAISFIDINGALVEDNLFINCTASTQPGPIDLEPDANAFAIIGNVTIRNNVFISCGGNVGEVSIFVPSVVTARPFNITIENNYSLNYSGSGSFVFFSDGRNGTSTSDLNNVKILRNYVKNGNRPFFIGSGRRHTIEGNVFVDCPNGAFISYTDNTINVVRDIDLLRNRFERVGSNNGSGLAIFNVNYSNIEKNKFIDCGTGSAGSSIGIDFNNGTSSYINFEGNEWSAPTSKTLVAIEKEASHTLTANTNRFVNNITGTLVNHFLAEESDILETAFTPTITGSTAAGAGTLTNTYAVYRRVGKTVFFKVKTTVAAGHTGTGMIQISLPTLELPNTNNQETVVNLALSGVTSTGGHVGLINPALIVGGVGAIRCYCNGTGTLTQITMPVGTFDVYASGCYQMP